MMPKTNAIDEILHSEKESENFIKKIQKEAEVKKISLLRELEDRLENVETEIEETVENIISNTAEEIEKIKTQEKRNLTNALKKIEETGSEKIQKAAGVVLNRLFL